ncbi:MAG: FAD/NAD(P)-binding oxidoreductase [Sulfuricurvum sp.]
MMKDSKILEEILNEVDKHPEIMSRRDALKYLTMSPLAATVLASATVATSEVSASADVKGKIVIAGGGLAGMATAARLNNMISNADITVIEPNPNSVSYQPGQTLVAAGVWDLNDIRYKRDDFVPKGVKLIAGNITSFDPDNNKLTIDGSQEVSYDYLVVAMGASLNYGFIKGIDSDLITSAGANNANVKKVVGQNGVHSLYFEDGAVATWKGTQELIAKAKAHTGSEKLKAVYTMPHTPIKCGGAPLKIMYLMHARLKEAGVADKVELTYYTDGGALFGIPVYNTPIVKQFEARGFKYNFKHNLTEVDSANKVAVFTKWWEQKEYDEDIEEEVTVRKTERVEVPFDFLHIVPPMKAPTEVASSKLGNGNWVTAVKETLQHDTYKNVFVLGDNAGIIMGKTGGSARKQYKVVVDNLIAEANGKPLSAKYDGYTVCPLITSLGTVMLAEFNWTKEPVPSFPLDPLQERWIWWLLKVYALKPMTIYGMLSGKA